MRRNEYDDFVDNLIIRWSYNLLVWADKSKAKLALKERGIVMGVLGSSAMDMKKLSENDRNDYGVHGACGLGVGCSGGGGQCGLGVGCSGGGGKCGLGVGCGGR